MNNKSTDGPLVVAIDSSTTSTKAIVVDVNGNVLGTAKRPIQLHTPAMDQYEHNPIRWWETSRDTIGEVISGLSPADRSRVSAIGVTQQRESFAPFKADGTPLRNGILWLDGRATEQIRAYGTDRVHQLSGKPAGVQPSIRWHGSSNTNRTHLPRLTRSSMLVATSVSTSLIDGPPRKHPPIPSASSISNRAPGLTNSSRSLASSATRWLIWFHLLTSLGTCAQNSSRTGVWTVRFASLRASATVRQPASALPQSPPDIAYLNLGTAVNAGVESPTYKYDSAVRTLVSGIPGEYVFEVLQSSGSYLAGWFREALGDPRLLGEPDPELDAAASTIPPGCEGLITLPYWNAVQSPYWDPVARGAVVGWRGTHSRAHMYRSILESIGSEMRFNLDCIEKQTGVRITALRAMGGGTRSKLWRQIMADTAGVPITTCVEDEISALGAAVLAMAGIEAHDSHDVAVSAKAMAHFGDTTEPDVSLHEQYKDVAEVQHRLYPHLQEVFEDLHTLANRYPSTKPESPKLSS